MIPRPFLGKAVLWTDLDEIIAAASSISGRYETPILGETGTVAIWSIESFSPSGVNSP
jgi:hypothetical protein